jgi:hypothetical protein
LPRLLGEVRHLVGEQWVTVVFDRGGWSPKLFGTMINDGFDLLIYRKDRCRRIGGSSGVAPSSTGAGSTICCTTKPVCLLKGKLRLRQVTRLCDDDHQTQVITSR